MSIGRKPKTSQMDSDWERVFYDSVGIYLQSIISELGRKSTNGFHTKETGEDLLEKIRSFNPKSFPAIKESEMPFDIPNHWTWCRLGEIIEFTSNLNIQSKFSEDTLIDYVDIDSIDNKKFKIREVKTKPVSELSSRARRVLKKGLVVYSLVRPYLNNLAIVEDDRENFIGSTGFAVFNGIFVNNEYLKFLLLTDFIRSRYLDLISGFNSPSISQTQFIETLVPLPPLSEQEKIVRFLNDFENDNLETEECYFDTEIEKKIINLHKSQLTGSEITTELSHQLELVSGLRQAFLREAMQGILVPQDTADEPAEVLLEKIKAEKEKLIAEKKIKKQKPLPEIKPEEIPFEIPNNWTWCRLGEICEDMEAGKSPKCENQPARKDEWGVIKTTAVQFLYFLENENKVLSKNFDVNPKHKVNKNDVLITRAGPTNRVGIVCHVDSVRDKLILSDKTVRIKYIKDYVHPNFLAIALNSDISQNFLKTKMGGMAVSQVNISQDNMKKHRFHFHH